MVLDDVDALLDVDEVEVDELVLEEVGVLLDEELVGLLVEVDEAKLLCALHSRTLVALLLVHTEVGVGVGVEGIDELRLVLALEVLVE
eukprot:326895-Amphidinium_carterae.1